MIDWSETSLASLLFVPGSDERKLKKVGGFGADAIVLDLEDAVANSEKIAARGLVQVAIAGYYSADMVVCARVNGAGTGLMEQDIREVVRPGISCLVVPKVEDPEILEYVAQLISEAEGRNGMVVGEVRLLALIETAKGLVQCEAISARAPERLLTLIFGLGDFSTDIGVDLTSEAHEIQYARSRIVVAAKAGGLLKPIDGPFLDLHNEDLLAADCRRSRQLGFQGRVTVYPPQVAPTQKSYSELPAEEVEGARRVVEAFEQSEQTGSASIRVDGRFVDYPIYFRALEKLKLHEAYKR